MCVCVAVCVCDSLFSFKLRKEMLYLAIHFTFLIMMLDIIVTAATSEQLAITPVATGFASWYWL